MKTTNQYFTRRVSNVRGPYTAREIRSLAESGQLLPTDQIRVDGSEKWVPVREVRGLFRHDTPVNNSGRSMIDSNSSDESRHSDASATANVLTGAESQRDGNDTKANRLDLIATTFRVTWLHLHTLAAYIRDLVFLRIESRHVQSTRLALGIALFDAGNGSLAILDELRKLSQQNSLNGDNNSVSVQNESAVRASLLDRLAADALSNGGAAADEALQPLVESARAASRKVDQLLNQCQERKASLAISDPSTLWRLAAGYGTVFVTLVIGYSLLFGRADSGRASVQDQWAAIWDAQRKSQELREHDRAKERDRIAAERTASQNARNRQTAELQALVKKANRLLLKDRFSEATAIYQAVLDQDEAFAQAHNGRGMVSLRLAQWSDAAKSFELAIKGDANFLLAYLNRAKCRVMLGQPTAATEDLDRAIQMDPSSAELYCWRAHAHRENKRYSESLRDIDSALKLDDSRPEPYFNRGAIRLENAEDLDRAISDFTAAIERDKTLTMAYLLRGSAKVRKKDFDGAIQDFRSATKLDPSLEDAYYNQALAAASSGKHDLAAKSFTETLRLLKLDEKSRQSEVLLARGESYLELSKFKEAEADFTRVVGINPRSDVAYENRAKARKAMNDSKAEDDLKIVADLRRPPEPEPEKRVASTSASTNFDRAAWASEGAEHFFNRASSYSDYSAQRAVRNYRSQMAGQLGVMGYTWAQ